MSSQVAVAHRSGTSEVDCARSPHCQYATRARICCSSMMFSCWSRTCDQICDQIANSCDQMRKWRDVMAKNFKKFSGRGDRIRTCDIYVPNVALYQSELHPGYRPRLPYTGFAGGAATAECSETEGR